MPDATHPPGVFPPQFYRYWGPGGAGGSIIQWGTPGDFDRCCTAINAKIGEHGKEPLSDEEIKGLCSNLHEHYTGGRPGHAPGVEEAMAEAKHDAAKGKS